MSALYLFGTMALIDLRAEIRQPVCHRREARIRTGYGVPQRKQHFSDAAHADAADADQVNTLEIVKGSGHRRATSSIKSTIFSPECGRACCRARVPSSTSLAGRSISARISRARRDPLNSGSGINLAAPERSNSSALRIWWLSVAAPKGMKMAARPAAATSETVMAPDRQTIRSASAKRSAIFEKNGATSASIFVAS